MAYTINISARVKKAQLLRKVNRAEGVEGVILEPVREVNGCRLVIA